MAASPRQTDASPFSFSSEHKPAALSRQTIIWLVVLTCVLVAAFIIVACLLCRCRRKRKDKRVSRGYSVKDGRNEFHPWNKNAMPIPLAPAYGGYGVVTAGPQVTVPDRVTTRPAVMEPMVVEEAGNEVDARRNTRKTNRYYSGWSARLSRFSQIGRAM